MNKNIVFQLLVVSFFAGVQIHAAAQQPLQITGVTPGQYYQFTAGIYNSSPQPLYIMDSNGTKYGATKNGSWIGVQTPTSKIYVFTRPDYTGSCLVLTSAGMYQTSPGNAAIVATASDYSFGGIALLYPGIGTNSIGLQWNGNIGEPLKISGIQARVTS